MNPGYTSGPWTMNPYTGFIRSETTKRRIGFFQGSDCTPAQRREHVVNCRLIELSTQLYEAMVELHDSHQPGTDDPNRRFNALAKAEKLIHHVQAPIVIPTRTPPSGAKKW